MVVKQLAFIIFVPDDGECLDLCSSNFFPWVRAHGTQRIEIRVGCTANLKVVAKMNIPAFVYVGNSGLTEVAHITVETAHELSMLAS
jgi:hypothetical protein